MRKIDKFKYWCHKVLPLVYDDSLSYYEVVCKCVDKLNEVIDSQNELIEDVEELQSQMAAVMTHLSQIDSTLTSMNARLVAAENDILDIKEELEECYHIKNGVAIQDNKIVVSDARESVTIQPRRIVINDSEAERDIEINVRQNRINFDGTGVIAGLVYPQSLEDTSAATRKFVEHEVEELSDDVYHKKDNVDIDTGKIEVGTGATKTTFTPYQMKMDFSVGGADEKTLSIISRTGTIGFTGGGKITGLSTPTANDNAANKGYVDSSVQSVSDDVYHKKDNVVIDDDEIVIGVADEPQKTFLTDDGVTIQNDIDMTNLTTDGITLTGVGDEEDITVTLDKEKLEFNYYHRELEIDSGVTITPSEISFSGIDDDGNGRIKDIKEPQSEYDAVNKKYVDDRIPGIASSTTTGVVKASSTYGIIVTETGNLRISKATNDNIDNRNEETGGSDYKPIVPANLDYAVKQSLKDNSQITNNDISAISETLKMQRLFFKVVHTNEEMLPNPQIYTYYKNIENTFRGLVDEEGETDFLIQGETVRINSQYEDQLYKAIICFTAYNTAGVTYVPVDPDEPIEWGATYIVWEATD